MLERSPKVRNVVEERDGHFMLKLFQKEEKTILVFMFDNGSIVPNLYQSIEPTIEMSFRRCRLVKRTRSLACYYGRGVEINARCWSFLFKPYRLFISGCIKPKTILKVKNGSKQGQMQKASLNMGKSKLMILFPQSLLKILQELLALWNKLVISAFNHITSLWILFLRKMLRSMCEATIRLLVRIFVSGL